MELFLLRLLLCRHFHDEVSQITQTLLVVVCLLGGNVDGLQSGASLECTVFYAIFFMINFLMPTPKVTHFNAVQPLKIGNYIPVDTNVNEDLLY